MRIEANSVVNFVGNHVQSSTSNTSNASSIKSNVQLGEGGSQISTEPVFSDISSKRLEGFSELAQKPKTELTMDEKQWIQLIERANKAIDGAICNFEYSIHEKTREIMIKVIDKDTKEVIREIPPAKVLDMVAKMWEMAGILVDERR